MHQIQFVICMITIWRISWALSEEEIRQFQARNYSERNTGTQGTVSVYQDPSDPEALVLESNGIPDHDTGTYPNDHNPNSIESKNNRWKVPMNPQKAASTTCLPMGPIGMATNGVAIFNPFTRTCCDAGTAELDLLDMCSGHPGPDGRYHYHIYPNCIKDIVCNTSSTIIGIAFDGFPIYGPMDENGKLLTKNDLDACNGRMDSSNAYKYHITKEYPYFMGCYSGSLRSDLGRNIGGNCRCTEPVEVCTEFGNRNVNVTWSSNVFSCCTDKESCNLTHTFVPNVTVVGGNSAELASNSALFISFAMVVVIKLFAVLLA